MEFLHYILNANQLKYLKYLLILKLDFKLGKYPRQKLEFMGFNADFFISYRILV